MALALTFAFAAPAFAQVSVSITSTPANGTHYVVGEAITTRLTIPQLNSGEVQNARMKLNIGDGGFAPIGNQSARFNATFHGNGHRHRQPAPPGASHPVARFLR